MARQKLFKIRTKISAYNPSEPKISYQPIYQEGLFADYSQKEACDRAVLLARESIRTVLEKEPNLTIECKLTKVEKIFVDYIQANPNEKL